VRIRLAALLLSVAATLSAGAAPPIAGLYGPEFTFTHNGSVPPEKMALYLNHLRNHLIKNQPQGAKFSEKMSTYSTFTSPNGWWFEVTNNPGVIEIRMSPLTVADTRRFKDDIQDAIFVSAANVELFPWDYLGGGHMNFDTRIFGGSVLLARNFLVDFWSHSELSMGILNYDTNNAMPLALYGDDEIAGIKAVIARADAGAYGKGEAAIQAFFYDINKIQYEGKNRLGGSGRGKHHDLNLNHRGRVEIRSVRPQANMDVWLNQIELIENRINNHLRHIKKPLPFQFKVPVQEPLSLGEPVNHRLVPPVDPQRALSSFYRYVSEAGLDWKDHRSYIWPPWVRSGELEKFEKSERFQESLIRDRQKRLARGCVEGLKP